RSQITRHRAARLSDLRPIRRGGDVGEGRRALAGLHGLLTLWRLAGPFGRPRRRSLAGRHRLMKGKMMIAEQNSHHDQRRHEVSPEDRPWVECVEEPGTQDHHGEKDSYFEAAEEHETAEQHVTVQVRDCEMTCV